MTFKRKAAPIAVFTAAALAMTACAQSDRESGSDGESGDTLTFGAAGAPAHFDPFYASDGETFRISRQLFDTLVMFKPGTAELSPALAQEWESTPDGKTWTFTLRDGVKFSDGTDVDAAAVCDNFERWANQSEEGLAASNYWAENFGGSKQLNQPSLYESCTPTEGKVEVKIAAPTSKFPSILGLPSFSIQSPTAMEKFNANNVTGTGEGIQFPEYAKANPSGSGPFTLEKYDTANQTITLKRNPDYWGTKAKVDKLVFKIIPDETTRKQSLEAGEIDGYDFPNAADWKSLQDSGKKVEIRPAFNIMYLGLNATKNPALQDLRVRQALAYAINREQFVKTQLPEGAEVAAEYFPDTVDGYNPDVMKYPYDAAKAKQLLQEAGVPNLELEFWYPSEVSRPYMPDPQKVFDAVRKDWEAVGVKVKPVQKPWNGGYITEVDAGAASSFLLGWTGDYNTADNFIGTFFSTTGNRFKTEAYPWGATLANDLKAADAIVDETQRADAYKKINTQLLAEYLPAIPISHSPPAIVFSDKVSGVVPSPLTDERYNTAEISK